MGPGQTASQSGPMGPATSPTRCCRMLRMPSIVTGRTRRPLEALVTLEGLPCLSRLIQVSPNFPHFKILFWHIAFDIFAELSFKGQVVSFKDKFVFFFFHLQVVRSSKFQTLFYFKLI